ncbi:metal-binding protein [Cyanobium sp. Copco_Reservoir_LC18]|uniref:metal-binding protein n=1 Tax=Cyanobium sp. Copco_Reservoir_LC18 TaxID=1328305 RepID=UPI00135CD153|nr:metal-binding protein [Cyanobium sp. Copco_Reservoir_LC18]KAF0654883.1 metal-binding protein [Cyanobium sp. Copco_Reservoir_LC18]
MASGRRHDRATGWLALPFGLLWGPALGPAGVAVASGAFLLGGLWLSPDLDTRSNATRRWGPLRLLWWPYRRLLSHRSLLSHSPLLGTGLRLLWLAALVLMACAALQPLGAPAPGELLRLGGVLWGSQRPLLLAALVGLEASSWLHLLQDGDPIPRLPRPLRALGRRLSSRSRRWRGPARRRERRR